MQAEPDGGAQCDAAMIRFAILRNVGHCFVKLGQFQDAIHSYEAVMDAWPDPHSGAISNRNTWMSAVMMLWTMTLGNVTVPDLGLVMYRFQSGSLLFCPG